MPAVAVRWRALHASADARSRFGFDATGIESSSVESWWRASRPLNSRNVASKVRHGAGQRVSRMQWPLASVIRRRVVSGKKVRERGMASSTQVAVQALEV